jgi:sigma-B regulation protein RsbU (phosphoserine phosphatase)
MFVTLCYAQLNPATGELIYVNAGHNPPLWYHGREDRLIELLRTGPALGVYDDRVYAQQIVVLSPGDFVLFYTDGITDALNAAEEEFGEARLREVILKRCRGSAGEIVAAVEQSLWSFVGERTPEDDITLVLLKRL